MASSLIFSSPGTIPKTSLLKQIRNLKLQHSNLDRENFSEGSLQWAGIAKKVLTELGKEDALRSRP